LFLALYLLTDGIYLSVDFLLYNFYNIENMEAGMKRIGVLTSGGDSPGMNPCIRAVVRAAIYKGLEVIGIKRGYVGLIENDTQVMDASSVSGIIYRGGTVLKTARSKEFMEKEGQERAVKI